MKINFIKMQACGNDFLIIDTRNQILQLSQSQIIQLADYKKSIGFDQLMLIENSSKADVAVKIFNRDGSEASACGNGSRCVARLILEETKKDLITISTANRILSAKWQGDLVAINMGEAKILQENIQFQNFSGNLVDIGNLHIIILEDVDILQYGPLIEQAYKANVNFVQIINKDSVNLKTWEIGAGATLSCGTGACASFYLLYKKNLVNKMTKIRQPGGEVYVSMDEQDILLAGEAEISYRGTFEQR